jgi:hypothetical protein
MNRRPERTRIGTHLFDPEEVATVVDLFAPVRLALEHARAQGRRPRLWPWGEWKVPLVVGAAILAMGVAGAALQARAVAVPAPRLPERAPVLRQTLEVPPPTQQEIAPSPATPLEPEPPAQARPPSEVQALAALNRRALAEYERSRSQPAVRLLSQALRLCQRPALAWHQLCAATHVNLGRVLAGGYGQSGLAAKHFRIADAIRPGSATWAPAGGRALRSGLTSGARSGASGR